MPPGIEGSGQSLADLLARIVGPGRGLEIVSSVNNIPKGSRLAVSTTLLAALVSVCMRATGQAASLTGQLQEHERRLVLARALLGEWLGGSGGGWQDSGGVWPGMKLIEGVLGRRRRPGVRHQPRPAPAAAPHPRPRQDASPETRRKLQDSLVLVHGGMAQNVGPILEMVTEKYLLRCEAEWKARQSMLGILDEILAALQRGDVRAHRRRDHPQLPPAHPDHHPLGHELLHRDAHRAGARGVRRCASGASGCSAACPAAAWASSSPRSRRPGRRSACRRSCPRPSANSQHALPFAMEPVVYDFAINERGTFADLLRGRARR